MDKVIKTFCGRITNFVKQPTFTFGKELQLHVMELKPNAPFTSPAAFDETMHAAVLTLAEFLERTFQARLLGMGMHPLLHLDETGIWPHLDRQIYDAYRTVFNLRRHGWLNIQSFQLNLPYHDEQSGIQIHNLLANICAYLPAISAASPVHEGQLGALVDNRMRFYKENQIEVPSVTGDVVPQYVHSFNAYQKDVIDRYSSDLARAGVPRRLWGREWVNSRGVIFRFDRRAIEIRVMDEQECIKSDVALSCFVRALLRGLLEEDEALAPHETLVKDFNSSIAAGLEAETHHPHGRTAREVCKYYMRIARTHASAEEKRYLSIVDRRINTGNLSDTVRNRLTTRAQRTDFKDAIITVYSQLLRSLEANQPYF